jgi:3-oxoacyl-[acyl-carrier-protein] synthase I
VKNKVYIRGKAVHCALGEDLDGLVAAMRTGQSPVSQIPLSLIGLDYSRPYFRLPTGNAPPGQSAEAYFNGILYGTVRKAIADAGLGRGEVERLPIFFGSTSIDIPIYEDNYRTARNVLSQTSSGYGNIANEIARHFDIRAACYTFTTACTSSANGVLFASAMIAQGLLERALVVGYDLYSNLGFYGFEALKLIAPPPYRPFDKHRQGVIMGEGCGAVILDKQRAAQNDFYYMGGANGCDTYSVTTHDPEGSVIAKVMGDALVHAGVAPGAIDAVKAHATGSYHNDLTECNGLRRVFQDRVPPVTGLKPFIGHTVGACGVIELVLFTEAVKNGFVPPTPGFEVPDEALAVAPITRPLAMERGTFLLNYFGFGGNCVSLVVANEN